MEAVTLTALSSQETLRDPASFYARLREHEPLSSFTFGPMKRWIIATTYDETAELLKDPRLVKDARNVFTEGMPQSVQQFALDYGEMVQLAVNNMLMSDPPNHTRLRGLVSKAFTPRMIEQLHPRIQQITDELLDVVQERGHMDLVTDFAYPLPMTVICEMLGIPISERADFRTWTRELLNSAYTPEQAAQVKAVGDTMLAYLRKLLAIKREHPGTDLTSSLLQVEEQGDKLSEYEL
ncbi:MAG: cytochrome P450, partial [Chloroflexi bacterium]|nr:cytochrome P450 [Chloroflexota bacterium]